MNSDCSTLLRYTQLVDKVRSGYDASCISLEQLARCFLFYLLSAVIFPNASGIGYLRFLPVLRDLRSLSRYSWGTAAFAYMYSGLDLACRGCSRIYSCLFMLDVSVIFSSGLDHFIFGGPDSFFDRFGLMSSGYFLTLLLSFHLRVGSPVFLDGFGRLPG